MRRAREWIGGWPHTRRIEVEGRIPGRRCGHCARAATRRDGSILNARAATLRQVATGTLHRHLVAKGCSARYSVLHRNLVAKGCSGRNSDLRLQDELLRGRRRRRWRSWRRKRERRRRLGRRRRRRGCGWVVSVVSRWGRRWERRRWLDRCHGLGWRRSLTHGRVL